MKHCVIYGSGSDIAQAIIKDLSDWEITGILHDQLLPADKWDLFVCAVGTMKPIGKFFDCPIADWEGTIISNAFDGLTMLRYLWPARKPGAKVVFMSGPNLDKPTPTYTAYRASKALLHSLVDTLNVEYLEHKFIW